MLHHEDAHRAVKGYVAAEFAIARWYHRVVGATDPADTADFDVVNHARSVPVHQPGQLINLPSVPLRPACVFAHRRATRRYQEPLPWQQRWVWRHGDLLQNRRW